MHYKISVKEIAVAGILSALAIITGIFGWFPLFGGNVYLIGMIVLLFPLFMKVHVLIIATAISLVITDLYSGYIAFTYISLIAYVGAVLIIKLFFKIFKTNKFIYLLSLVLSGIWLLFIYYTLELIVIGKSYALKDLISTSIQLSIVIPICLILYYPSYIISKGGVFNESTRNN